MLFRSARYPAFDARAGRPIDLEQRINQCRVEQQGAPALARESRELLALAAFVSRQSRGLPIEDQTNDERLKPFIDRYGYRQAVEAALHGKQAAKSRVQAAETS